MKLKFKRKDNELLLGYFPESIDVSFVLDKIDSSGSFIVKRCFEVTKDLLRIQENFNDNKSEFTYDDSINDEELWFCIGVVDQQFTRIDCKVLGIEHNVYFSNNIELNENMFITYNRISIFYKLNIIIQSDIYIGEIGNEMINLPFSTFMVLIRKFPNSTELFHYSNARITTIIKEYFIHTEVYEKKFKKHIERKDKISVFSQRETEFSYETNKLKLEQFKITYDELKNLLDTSETITEYVWQDKIFEIIRLIYPKYILGEREISIKGVDGYNKRPDFLLVDANGFIDIMEIKKPSVELLTMQSIYRNNYVPVREFSGTIQQIEKYIFCLNHWGKEGENYLNDKLKNLLPDKLLPKVVNPIGLLILGRSKDFNEQQKSDFELIKRQYKHITDIMSYDDLLFRISNILAVLEIQEPND